MSYTAESYSHLVSIAGIIEILQQRNGVFFTEECVKNAIVGLGFADESGNYRFSEMMLRATFMGPELSHLSQNRKIM